MDKLELLKQRRDKFNADRVVEIGLDNATQCINYRKMLKNTSKLKCFFVD